MLLELNKDDIECSNVFVPALARHQMFIPSASLSISHCSCVRLAVFMGRPPSASSDRVSPPLVRAMRAFGFSVVVCLDGHDVFVVVMPECLMSHAPHACRPSTTCFVFKRAFKIPFRLNRSKPTFGQSSFETCHKSDTRMQVCIVGACPTSAIVTVFSPTTPYSYSDNTPSSIRLRARVQTS